MRLRLRSTKRIIVIIDKTVWKRGRVEGFDRSTSIKVARQKKKKKKRRLALGKKWHRGAAEWRGGFREFVVEWWNGVPMEMMMMAMRTCTGSGFPRKSEGVLIEERKQAVARWLSVLLASSYKSPNPVTRGREKVVEIRGGLENSNSKGTGGRTFLRLEMTGRGGGKEEVVTWLLAAVVF